jgi:isoleucyl-tRNA synthetase
MIWTTTPWTLPANLAVAVHERFTYALVRVDGNVTVVVEDLVEKVTKLAKAEDVEVLARTTGDRARRVRYRHPFIDEPADGRAGGMFADKGCYSIVRRTTSRSRTARGWCTPRPGTAPRTTRPGLRVGLPVYCPVRGDGTYDDTVPEWLRGVSVWEANEQITEHLRESGHLFHDHRSCTATRTTGGARRR